MFSNGIKGFQISPLLQELMVFLGQKECYEKCPEMIKKTIGIEVGHSQIYRVADSYGKEVEKKIEGTRTLPPLEPEDVLYVEVDGSMIFTRDDGWKEVKVGRVFKDSDCIDPNGKQSWIRHSQYLAHLGSSKFFTDKMDTLIESYGELQQRLVFISDGASWIRNWIEDSFSEAISILDYYHAIEHLYEFANSYFKEESSKEEWIEKQKKLLLSSKVEQVIKNIEQLPKGNKTAENLIAYYKVNSHRMDYKAYKKIGCGIIGSGAIESAHRLLIQKRMKLSGQRWSSEGAQNMLNLRVVCENKKWDKVICMAKTTSRGEILKKVA